MMATGIEFEGAIKRFQLTEVFTPTNGGQVDVVFVHGINGNPYGTWTSEQNQIFWPAQLLPPVVKEEKARLLVYGYDADIGPQTSGVSNDKVHNHAEQLIATLYADRRNRGALERPIVFVAHCLGGIVVKRALIYSAGIRGRHTEHRRSIFISTYGILFLGTPHYGTEIARWHSWSEGIMGTIFSRGSIDTQSQIPNALKPDCETLQNIERQFVELTSSFRIYYFHETKKTNVNGTWRYIVDEGSAAPVIQDVERAAIQQDHAKMCTFENDASPGFDLVTEAIQRYAAEAPGTIRPRWEIEKSEQRVRRNAEANELTGNTTSGAAQLRLNDLTSNQEAAPSSSAPLHIKSSSESQPKRHYIVPRERVKDFVGREAQLDGISAYFSGAANQIPKVLILHALGGQGKSQIVLEYCQRSRKQYRGIFWVNASTESLALQSYTRIALALSGDSSVGLKDGNRSIEVVQACLEDWNEPWLLVFDNYDKPNDFATVQRFFPKSEYGRIIFTSRNRDLDRLGSLMEIPGMSSDDGVRLLTRNYSQRDTNENPHIAQEIVRRLGNLALAIDQAAAYIQYRRISPDRLGEFLAAYDLQRQKILSYTPGKFWEYGTAQIDGKEAQNKSISAFTTWEMSLEQLMSDNPLEKNEITHFLTLSAFFNPAHIGESLFLNYWDSSGSREEERSLQMEWLRVLFTRVEEADTNLQDQKNDDTWDADCFWDTLAKLNDLSLLQELKRDTQETAFSLHPLIQDWLQLRLELDDRQKYIAESFAVVARSVKSSEHIKTRKEMRASLLAHVDACISIDERFSDPPLQGELAAAKYGNINWLAIYYFDRALHRSAKRLLGRYIEMLLPSFDGEYTEVIIDLSTRLLYTLLSLEEFDEALKIAHRVRNLCELKLGMKDRHTLSSLHLWATALEFSNRSHEAALMHRRTLHSRQEVLGENDRDTLMSMEYLAITLAKLGEHAESEEIARDLLARQEMVSGINNRSTLTTMDALAFNLECQNKHIEASVIRYQALDLSQKVKGKEHPDTCGYMQRLARTLEKFDLDRAEKMFRQVLQIRGEVLGEKHPDMLWSMDGLAMVLCKQGKIDESMALAAQTLELREQTLGLKHLDTLGSAHTYVIELRVQRRYDEIVNLCRRTLPVMQEVGYPHTLGVMFLLAKVLRELDNIEEAEEVERQALKLRESQGEDPAESTHDAD